MQDWYVAAHFADELTMTAVRINRYPLRCQVEAQITKLKLVKRQLYGCAKLDLLRARPIGAQ